MTFQTKYNQYFQVAYLTEIFCAILPQTMTMLLSIAYEVNSTQTPTAVLLWWLKTTWPSKHGASTQSKHKLHRKFIDRAQISRHFFKAHCSLSYVSGDKMLWHFLCAFTFMVITSNYHCLGRIFIQQSMITLDVFQNLMNIKRRKKATEILQNFKVNIMANVTSRTLLEFRNI